MSVAKKGSICKIHCNISSKMITAVSNMQTWYNITTVIKIIIIIGMHTCAKLDDLFLWMKKKQDY